MTDTVDKKGVIKIMSIALAVAILGIVFLGWQYRILEKKQLPALEEKIEENSARDVLRMFLQTKADILLTERAMEQKNKGEFVLMEDTKSYEILKTEKNENSGFVFYVEIDGLTQVITVIKIPGVEGYYIDSIQTAG